MSSSRIYAFLTTRSVLAVIGVAIVLVLGRGLFGGSPTEHPRRAAALSQIEAPQVDRLAFVQPGVLSLPEPRLRQSIAALPDELPGADEEWDEPPAVDDPEGEETAEAEAEADADAQDPDASSADALADWATRTEAARPKADPERRVRTTPQQRRRPYTLTSRLAEIGPGATARLVARFEDAKAPWPPAEIVFIAIKDERMLELHARPRGGPWALIHRYRVLGASGGPGPKLRQGDKQVPEGIYRISFLNPNSAFHVSLRVNYPNAFDRKMAAKEGRKDLGGDIMIHGKDLSAGCLAMGDEAVEELFVLAARTGLGNVRLIIAPTDLRRNPVPGSLPGRPEWLPHLYTEIASAMSGFEAPQQIVTSSTSIASELLSFFTK